VNITSIDGKLDVSWHPEILTVLESWSDYDVELESFRKAVFVKGINHIKASRGKAWIFDPGSATGSFGPEVQAMIDADRFAALGWTGAKILRDNQSRSDGNLGQYRYRKHPRCSQRVEAPSVDGAMAWIKAQP
jgi:hypothetical protein